MRARLPARLRLSGSALFALRRPSESEIRRYLAAQSDLPFSYGEVGAAWKDAPPKGYAVDSYQVRLGEGEEAFARAKGRCAAANSSTSGGQR